MRTKDFGSEQSTNPAIQYLPQLFEAAVAELKQLCRINSGRGTWWELQHLLYRRGAGDGREELGGLEMMQAAPPPREPGV